MAGARNLPGLIVGAAGSVVVSIERAKGEITLPVLHNAGIPGKYFIFTILKAWLA